LNRPRFLRPRDAGAVERGDAADQALPGHEDRAAVHVPAVVVGRAPLRIGGLRVALPGTTGAHTLACTPELHPDQYRTRRLTCVSSRLIEFTVRSYIDTYGTSTFSMRDCYAYHRKIVSDVTHDRAPCGIHNRGYRSVYGFYSG